MVTWGPHLGEKREKGWSRGGLIWGRRGGHGGASSGGEEGEGVVWRVIKTTGFSSLNSVIHTGSHYINMKVYISLHNRMSHPGR